MSFGGAFGRGWGNERRNKKKTSKTIKKLPRPSRKSRKAAGVLRTPRRLAPDQIPKEYSVPLGARDFNVVILSASPSNLKACLKGVFQNEPNLMEKVVVVDDGAKEGLEDIPGVIWVPGIKPFVFARNANVGIKRAAPHDVILLNDDAILQTPGGFTLMEQVARERPSMGICSGGVLGHVGNPNQEAQKSGGVRRELKKLAFVCVYITRAVLSEIGELDERFVGYGYEDDDYCTRVTQAGMSLGVFDGCVVEHALVPSTFRAKPDYAKLITDNRKRYEEKWGSAALRSRE